MTTRKGLGAGLVEAYERKRAEAIRAASYARSVVRGRQFRTDVPPAVTLDDLQSAIRAAGRRAIDTATQRQDPDQEMQS